MLKIPRILRHHPLFFICAPLLVIALTWPTLFYVFNTDIFWLPSYDFDVWMKFWDAWYGGLILRGEADFYFTDLLFYPEGLSLVYHNFNIPHILVFGSLQRFMPGSAAYNLSHLLIVFANISAAYLYLYYLLRDKPSSLLGALIFGLNPFVLNHSHHPDLNLIASLPLSLYFLERGLGERRWKWILSAGFCAGFTVFIGMYIFVCLLFSLALRLLSLVRKDWRERDFWLRLLVLAALIGAIGLVRVYPIVQDSNALEEALGKNDGEERFRDLLAYVVCPGHPLSEQLFARVFDQPVPDVDKYGFLGYLPLLLIVFGATRASFRRRLWPWLLVALPFMVLRLGSVLTIGGWTYDSILLPKYYLDTLFPAIFEAFWETSHFQIGILLPLAFLASLAMLRLLEGRSMQLRWAVVALALAWLAFEYYQPPQAREFHRGYLAFNTWLEQEAEQEEIRLINLPLRRKVSKLYGFYQAINGYPHIEGLASRTPRAAYATIDGNYLLRSWKKSEVLTCQPANEADYLAAVTELAAAGFSHVVAHQRLDRDRALLNSLNSIPAVYADYFTTIYKLSDLRQSCSARDFALADLVGEGHSALLPAQDAASLRLLEEDPGLDSARRYLATLRSQQDFLRIAVEDITGPPADWRKMYVDSLLDRYSAILLDYAPGAIAPEMRQLYTDWLARRFQTCGRLRDEAERVVEYFFRAGFPCALALDSSPLTVHYDNGMQLVNLLREEEPGQLQFYFLWQNPPPTSHAVSIQFFDATGAKVYGQDFVTGREALAQKAIDISALPPGEYSVQLILYEYASGASVSGTVGSAGPRFERALELEPLSIQ